MALGKGNVYHGGVIVWSKMTADQQGGAADVTLVKVSTQVIFTLPREGES